MYCDSHMMKSQWMNQREIIMHPIINLMNYVSCLSLYAIECE